MCMLCGSLERILDYVNEKGRVNAYEVAALFCDAPDLIDFVRAWTALDILAESDLIGITENRFAFCALPSGSGTKHS